MSNMKEKQSATGHRELFNKSGKEEAGMEMEMEILEQELKWEMESFEDGVARYKRNSQKGVERGAEAFLPYGRILLKAGFGPVIERLTADLKRTSAGRHMNALKLMRKIDPEKAIYIALQTVLNTLSHEVNFTKTAISVGKMIEDEVKISEFVASNPLYKRFVEKKNKSTNNYQHKIASLTHTMNTYKPGLHTPWTVTEKLHVGSYFIGIIVEETGIFEIRNIWRAGREMKVIAPTQKTVDWLSRFHSSAEAGKNHVVTPQYRPTLLPPQDWTNPFDGGYYHPLLKGELIKTNKQYLEEISNRNMETVYRGINAIQKTAWRINRKVYEVAKEVWRLGWVMEDMPSQDPLPLPPCPICGQTKEENEKHPCFEYDTQALTEWKQSASKVHRMNGRLSGKRLLTLRILYSADLYADKERFFFPYNMDFRGRLYTIPTGLTPQGSGLAKGLLEFADGKPLGKTGGKWLAIHTANCYGIDKVSFEERLAWVREHTPDILAVAESPLDNRFWVDADSPWQFLACCFEWAGYMKEGEAFVSHLPISLDGSCNGIQHFSAMLRDEKGGRSVNLVPSDQPQDIYGDVARQVAETLQEIVASESADSEQKLMAQKWLGFGINRKTVKRPVMVLPYGGTRFSCRDYIEEYLDDCFEAGQKLPWASDVEKFEAALFLSNIVWDAIEKTLTGATKVMTWLQQVARKYNRAGIPITWVTPTGFPVCQKYPETETKRIKTHLLGSFVYINLKEELDTIDKKKQVSSISPNFVHSLDASTLIQTVNRAVEAGIASFMVIHDSFGVHASDTEIFAQIIRETFVDLYTRHDPLKDFHREACEAIGEDIPKPPAKGKLKIDSIKQSLYFFA